MIVVPSIINKSQKKKFKQISHSQQIKLMRATRSKFEETENKRKNSNSDKEDDVAGGENGAGASTIPIVLNNEALPTIKNRKQTNNNNINNNNNNNNQISGKNHNNKDCDMHNDNVAGKNCDDIGLVERLQMSSSIYESSPVKSISALSQQTIETNPDGTPVSRKMSNMNGGMAIIDATALVHSATLPDSMQKQNGNNDTMNSNDFIGAAAGQPPTDELNVIGGINRRVRLTICQIPSLNHLNLTNIEITLTIGCKIVYIDIYINSVYKTVKISELPKTSDKSQSFYYFVDFF